MSDISNNHFGIHAKWIYTANSKQELLEDHIILIKNDLIEEIVPFSDFSNNEDLNILFSTEHGPSGGDEINYLKFNELNNNKVSNYGWPMSSYGRHYHDDNDDNDERYKLAPLKKSHSKYGYVEPLKYFDPSVGISQIIGLPKKFSGEDNYKFVVGTMGNAKKFKEGMLSLYFFEFDNKDEKIVNSEIIPIKSRVRDMVYVDEENIVLMFLENYNSLGILRKK